jgi:hypothetical protein
MDQLVADIVNQLDADLREDFDERAGIMEFDAGLPREHAECLALIDLLRRYPNALSGVTVIEARYGDISEWLLTTNVEAARYHLTVNGGIEVGTVDLAHVIDQRYTGLAMLTTVS